MRRVVLSLFLVAAPAAFACGEEPAADLRAIIDELAEPVVREGKAVGVVVGVITPEVKLAVGYGRKSAGGDEPPDGDTLFEIGSITKVFTSLCLADMVEEELVTLDDRIETHLPPGIQFKNPPPRPITLKLLATHTSGLPRIPLAVAFADPRDPYARFNEERLVEMLNSYEWQPEAGTKFAYSNLAMGMLGWMLARRNETTYEQLVIQRICDPLHMDDTRITLSDDQRKRLAPGHTPEGKPSDNWSFDVLAGAGAIRSTANDLLRFAEANLDPDNSSLPPRLAKAIARSHAPHGETDDPRMKIGLAWMIRAGNSERGPLLWHSGATGAYTSFLGMLPERGIAVVVLSNTQVSSEGLVAEMLGAKLGRALEARAPAAEDPK
jgi:CubicO group peptidase (beta-lactamase class C family)